MMSYLQDTNAVEVYNGSAWVAVGGGGLTSPLTTKGDIWVYGTGDTRLPVGTNGHTLVADSSVSPTGLKWAVDPVADVVTTAGDLLYATAADTVTRLGIGTASQVLAVNSGATAPEWVTPAAGGGMTLLSTTSITQTSSITVSSISGSYTNLMIIVENFKAVTDNTTVLLRFNSDTGSNYGYNIRGESSGSNSGVTSIATGGVGLDNSNNSSTMTLTIPLYASTAAFKSGLINTGWQQNDGYWFAYSGGFGYKSTSAISSFTLLTGGGDFAAQGTIKIYGVN
jgi:hypothetical protein